MKIGILTLPLHNNYGGILQNWALQTYLKRAGHEVYTINCQTDKKKYNKLRLLPSCIKRFFKKIGGDKNIIFINPSKQNILFKTPGIFQIRFIERNIDQITIKEKITNDFQKLHNFETYIIGSDQVWRPRFTPFLPNFYLDFLQDNRLIKKIAYSASFGVDTWEASKEITPFLVKFAKNFDFISVRESSAIDLCKNHLEVDACQTLDPTMLLDADYYRKLVKKENEDAEIGKNKACIYILDMNEEKLSLTKEICTIKQLQMYRVGEPCKKGFPSIESWLNGFDKSEFVITDSFHGTVFAILFKKPFVCLANQGRGLSRFSSLLTMFGLSSQLITKVDSPESLKNIVNFDIDYDFVHKILSNHRYLSESFLVKALNN